MAQEELIIEIKRRIAVIYKGMDNVLEPEKREYVGAALELNDLLEWLEQ